MTVGRSSYQVDLLVEGLPCLVVGGGHIGARKARQLVEAGARVHVVATVVGDEIKGLAGTSWDERPYRRGDVEGYWLVMTATGDPTVDGLVFEEAQQAHIWVNSADDPEHCTFTLPATLRRGRMQVAVSTGGSSPAFSGWMRDRLDAELGPEYEPLLDLLADERESMRRSGRPLVAADWRAALDSGMLEMIREGRLAEAKERLQACLSSSSD